MRGEGQEGQCAHPLPFAPPPRLRHPCPPGYDAPCPLERMPGGHRGRCPPPVRGQSPLPGLLFPLRSRAPPRPHAIHPFCAHARSAGGTGVCARGGPHARGPRAKGVLAWRGATRVRGAARERSGSAKMRRRDPVRPQVREKGVCVRVRWGTTGQGAARERKSVRTVSAPPRPVNRLRENPVTYLVNKIEFLLLVKE